MLVYEDMIDRSTETFVYFDGLNKSIDELRELARRFEDISCYLSTALREQKTLDVDIADEFLKLASNIDNDVHKLAHKILFKKVD